MHFETEIPQKSEEARQKLFAGDIYLKGTSEASRSLVADVIGDMQRELEMDDIRKAHQKWSDAELFAHFGALRRHFYLSEEYHEKLKTVVVDCGFAPGSFAFDPIRIRVVLPGGHHNPKAAPVYYPHRDTWYAHPQSLIVWWIPLHDLRAEETFEFYPDSFTEPVDNDSEIFDYSDWVKDGPALKIGWQKQNSGETAGYPQAISPCIEENRIGFSCKAAEQLIFAGAHFHRTLPQDFETIRYSLDFRVVHLDDWHSGAGAPNVDNRSKGSTFGDYIR